MTSLRHSCRSVLMLVAALFAMVGAARATVIYSDVMTLTAADPIQLGRLSRDGIASDWSAPKPFPGMLNPATPYHYKTLDLDLGALESSFSAYGGFIQISFDSEPVTTFLSSYLNAYSPLNLSTNYLGDPGTSGNFFGNNPLFFQVVVPSSNHLVLVLNETSSNGGLNLPGSVLVEAFLDTEFTDLPVSAPVPEPGTWALLAGGITLLVVRRRGLGSN